MDDFRAAIPDFCPVIPAKAGIQRGGRGVGETKPAIRNQARIASDKSLLS